METRSAGFCLARLIAPLVLGWPLALGATARAQSDDPVEADAAKTVELAGPTMGTTYHVKYWGDAGVSPANVQRAISQSLDEFDRQMSTYRDDSELSRFNRCEAHEWFPVSPATAQVVAAAVKWHKLTEGALDVTCPPLLKLWNLAPGANSRQPLTVPPTEAQLAEAMSMVGVDRLRVRLSPPALRKDRAGVEVDLSSIAPGYAVDLLIDQITALGFANAMVEIGGEVRAIGRRRDGRPWRVGVERANQPGAKFARVVDLQNLALTTAGDYRNVSGAGDAKFTHIIDPATGQALPFRGVSVAVIAERCIDADALDTALLVMGPERGYQWCVQHDVAALFQTGERGERVRTTPRFDELTGSTASATP